MRTIRTKVYQFSELSEQAKQKAIEVMRDINTDYDWWESVYEDFLNIGEYIGVEIDLKKTYFSGFAHQGKGATFTAEIDLNNLIKGIATKHYLEYAPNIEEENKFTPSPCPVDKRVIELISRGIIDISADIKTRDRSYSSQLNFSSNYTYNQCIDYNMIDAELEKLEEWITEIMEELDRLLFNLLEKEYEYQTSDEAITETIEANEYEFKADGTRF